MGKVRNWFENVIPDAQAVFRRFPMATILVAAFTIVLLIENNFVRLSNEMMMRLIGGIILAAYVSVILTLHGEGRDKTVSIVFKLTSVILCLLAGYFFRQLAIVMPAAIGASILFLGNAPFWRGKREDIAVWDFTHKLWTAVMFTVAGSVIYVIGIFSIIFALKSLFGVDMYKSVVDWMLPIGLGFLAPMAWLSMLPRHDDEEGDSLRNPGFVSKAVGFLGTWILAPLTLIYAVILVAYGAKILLSQQVPNGQIAALVTPFLVVGTLTWLILDPPFIQKKRLARWYTKLWFPLTIPAALLLGYAVFARIGQYGWTVERYLLVLAAAWALGIAVWFMFRGEAKRDIRIIPGFAALLLAIASIGPWGAHGVSTYSQASRLKTALVANEMLNDAGLLKPLSALNVGDDEQGLKAKGALHYLVRQKKLKQILKFVPDDEKTEIRTKMVKGDYWNNSFVNKRFGLKGLSNPVDSFINNRYEYNPSAQKEPIYVSGYEYVSQQQSYDIYRKNSRRTNTYKMGDYKIETTDNSMKIYNKDNIVIAENDIWKWLREQPVNSDNNTIILDPYLVLYEKDDAKITMYITFAVYENDTERNSIRYILLVKGL